jgi:glucose-1-phosphate thymidylyltransferase
MYRSLCDTLFKADFSFDDQEDGVIWTQKVADPSSFGVVKLDAAGYISEMVEKPTAFVSDLAIVGIYYFREGEKLRDALQHIVSNDIREKNEYQLTTALELLKNQGVKFRTGEIEEWLDCGTKENILHSNARMLEFHRNNGMTSKTAVIENSVIVHPCFIGEHAEIRNSVIGPHVSVGHHSTVEGTVISNSIIQNHAEIKNAVLDSSMIGNSSRYEGSKYALDLGDFSNFSKR